MATDSSSAPAVKLAGGRPEFRAAGGAALVRADPPEAGWRLVRPEATKARMNAKAGDPR